jgi:hypothetical protein
MPQSGMIFGANDRLNVSFIGLGVRGSALLQMVLPRAEEQKDVEVVGVCDVYQKRLTAAAEKARGARQYVYHQELLVPILPEPEEPVRVKRSFRRWSEPLHEGDDDSLRRVGRTKEPSAGLR